MIRILIIEDEEMAVQRITGFLQNYPNPNNIVARLDCVKDSIEFLMLRDDYDLIILDIHLSDGNSFEIFNHLNVNKPIIFITAYDEYAVRAFKQLSIDYLLKPLKKEEFFLALEKYRNHFSKEIPDYKKLSGNEKPNRLLIKVGQHIKTIEKEDITYYFTSAKTTYVVTSDGKKYPLEHTLEQIEKDIMDDHFLRVNRQYIVHKKSIESIHKHTKSRLKVWLKGKKDFIVISTEKTPLFKEWIVV